MRGKSGRKRSSGASTVGKVVILGSVLAPGLDGVRWL